MPDLYIKEPQYTDFSRERGEQAVATPVIPSVPIDSAAASSSYNINYKSAFASPYVYSAWGHTDGLRYKATRTRTVAPYDVTSIFDENPQPTDLAAFQALGW